MLEPDAVNAARPVLRGTGRSNAPGLPGELVGSYANGGVEWQPVGEPERVNVHDFPDPAVGTAIPYGVDELGAGAGWVSVGCDHDTAGFAVATLRRWWEQVGRAADPDAGRLLVTADAGGSNGYRLRRWKTELARFAADTGLQVTVCHFPPGTPSGTKSSIGCSARSRPTGGAGHWSPTRWSST